MVDKPARNSKKDIFKLFEKCAESNPDAMDYRFMLSE